MQRPSSVPPVSRRDVLRWGALAGAAALLPGCGFSTTGGGGGPDAVTFLSTQFAPIEEAQRFRDVLNGSSPQGANYIPVDAGQFATQVRSQVERDQVRVGLLGGLHGDLAPLAGDYLEDVTDLVADLRDRGYLPDFVELSKAGTDRSWYVPWMQATYVFAAHDDALAALPSRADPEDLTYDQLLDWAIAARKANGGKAALGLPAGPDGLFNRFLQGYLYPSFTGAQVTGFRSPQAVTMWQYLRELWANTTKASTNFAFMQEPLRAGQVRIGWDHVARLVDAPSREPQRWLMFRAPRGPEARGWMAVLAGLAIPKGAPAPARSRRVITGLSRSQVQLQVLRDNAFFPVVDTRISGLSPAVELEAAAVRATQRDDGLLSLPPVGLGELDGLMSKAYVDSFNAIVRDGSDIRSTLDKQAKVVQGLLDQAKSPCWRPDRGSGDVCEIA